MLQALGNTWLNFYLKQVRRPLFGLSPLQQYIVDNHDVSKESTDPNPLLTYLYFVAYEKEVWERKCVHELLKENQATDEEKEKYEADEGKFPRTIYLESISALLESKTENTRIKMILHMVSLIFIATLMVSAAAVSTGKLMEMWAESFGPYAYLAQAFFYVSAVAGQWMIYRKTVPEVLKKLFYYDKEKGWHFKLDRNLKINGAELEDTIKDQPNYSKAGLFLFVICSGLLALSLGMIVLDTSGGTIEDGNVFKSMEGINALAQAFGGVSSFGWVLCIASILCNFALFISASLKYLFERAKDKEEDAAKDATFKYKVGAVVALAGLVILNYFGLTATLMSQGVSTLGIIGISENSAAGLIILPIFTFVAGICGRGIFNVRAMENLRVLMGEMWDGRADIARVLKDDVRDYKWTYALGAACVATVSLVFGLSYVGETSLKWLNFITDSSTILPVILSLASAIGIFSVFKMGRNYSTWQNNPPPSPTAAVKTLSDSPNSATKHKFTLKHDSERRSGQQLLMILGNSVGGGAIAASAVQTFLLYGSKNCEELKITLTVLAMFAGALMSMGSAMNRVNANVDKPAKSPTVSPS